MRGSSIPLVVDVTSSTAEASGAVVPTPTLCAITLNDSDIKDIKKR